MELFLRLMALYGLWRLIKIIFWPTMLIGFAVMIGTQLATFITFLVIGVVGASLIGDNHNPLGFLVKVVIIGFGGSIIFLILGLAFQFDMSWMLH
jgi:hypothetical protein